jgi:hypothetical protein
MTHHTEYTDDIPSTSSSSSSWAANALDDSAFRLAGRRWSHCPHCSPRQQFDRWKSLASVRVVFAMVGWMGFVTPSLLDWLTRMSPRNCGLVFIHQMMSLEIKADTVK